MKKLFSLFLLSLFFSVAAHAFFPISGPTGVCVGSSATYTIDSAFGGSWSSSNPSVATIGASSGYLTGVSVGTAMITFSSSAGTDVRLITVTAVPAPITGATTLCTGHSTILTDATPGGAGAMWTSSSGAVSVDSGTVSGMSPGTATITYMPTSAASACIATIVVTVDGPAVGHITGDSSLCMTGTVLLTDTPAGGAWSSSDPAVASVDASGNVTGVSAGWAYIYYTVVAGCGTTTTSLYVYVDGATSAGTIMGIPSSFHPGSTAGLYVSGASGTGSWSSSDPLVASVGASGHLTGVGVGTAIITYVATGCTGSLSTTAIVTVTAATHIAGTIHLPSAYTGSLKVWLITYNPATLDLEAVDSAVVHPAGSDVNYIFFDPVTDSFRVKAAIDTDYVTFMAALPTYHTSSYYWHDADVIYHVAGTNTDGVDIDMMAGMTTSGPCFIAGNVTTGANKGTSGSVPVAGMKIYAVNTATGTVVQAAITDAAGAYTLASLPYGTYMVFPDSLNYLTTPMTGVTLSAADPGRSGAAFKQHTLSHTITPVPTAVAGVAAAHNVVFAYPNPAKGWVKIGWNVAGDEQANVLLSDVTGRSIYAHTIELTTGAGSHKVDVSAVPDGIYIITVQSAPVNYTGRLEIRH